MKAPVHFRYGGGEQWVSLGFGQIEKTRTFFFSSLSFFLRNEVILSSVFLSTLRISRDTYIGE